MKINKIIDFKDEEGDIAREMYKTNERVLKFVKLMKKGIKFPPITISESNFLLDGMHRLTAYKLLGKKDIEVEYERSKTVQIRV